METWRSEGGGRFLPCEVPGCRVLVCGVCMWPEEERCCEGGGRFLSSEAPCTGVLRP